MSGPEATRVVIRVSGRVQGVFFRASARDEARRLGLAGWARNEPDGSVLIDVEGAPAAIEAFLTWCATGPPNAQVASVDITPAAPIGRRDFTVVR